VEHTQENKKSRKKRERKENKGVRHRLEKIFAKDIKGLGSMAQK
jgi:hypothetical protein